MESTPIVMNLDQNKRILEDRLKISVSFDLGNRELVVSGKKVILYYVTGLCDATVVVDLLRGLQEEGIPEETYFSTLYHTISHQQVEIIDTMEEGITPMLSGLLLILVEGEARGILVDVRSYPGRTPEEPDTEKVVRGSRDGYTENIIENTALTRRRIRDKRLRNELMQIGERSKTDVCISYIEDVANPDLLKVIKERLEKVEVDGLTMADKMLEEYIVKQGRTPFPLVRYTERPDVAASHLLEGHILVMVDTSPSIMITPTTFFHHVQHAEEYRQSPVVGTFVRWVRFFGMLTSVFLLPMWLLLSIQPELTPEALSFIGPKEEGTIPLVVQILIADIGIELLRIAAIHTPTPLSTSMGLIAAVLIGQIAIDVGLFGPEAILYVAASAIGTYSTPSYELSVAHKISRILLLILTALFGVKGFFIGILTYTLSLISTKSFRTPYLWPLLPFNGKAFIQILFRFTNPSIKVRPSIVRPKDTERQS